MRFSGALVARRISDAQCLALIDEILASSPIESAMPAYFFGDDLFEPYRRRRGAADRQLDKVSFLRMCI